MRHLVLLTLLLALAGGCAEPAASEKDLLPDGVDPGGKTDIYGSDDRREVFDAEAVYQRVAQSTALVATSSDFYIGGNGHVWLEGTTYSEKIQGSLGAPLCSTERFADQPAPGYCSAFLLAPDLVATAGHCVNISYLCDELRFVFGFQYDRSAHESDVGDVPPDNFYRCASVVGHVYDKDAVSVDAVTSSEYWPDWAIVQLDRPVVGRTALPLRRTGQVAGGGKVSAVGYPGGIPAKVTAGRVVDNSHSLYFNTDMDIYGGNSGGVVVNPDGVAEGIVIRGTGGNSFTRQGACFASDVCTAYDPNRASGCTGNHVMRIDPVLQFVDSERIVKAELSQSVPIPDGQGSATLQLTLDDPGQIRFLTLNTSVSHWSPKDLEISLERETGHSAVLFHAPTLQKSSFSGTTDEFAGEPAAGTWTVHIRDLNPGNVIGSQEMNFAQLVVGIGDPVSPPPAAKFIGSDCLTDAACTFGPDARCLLYDDAGTPRGMCVLPCEGACPDRAGFATTFCTSVDGGLSGVCVPKAHAANAYCTELPGTAQTGVNRYVGSSSSAAANASVCLPL